MRSDALLQSPALRLFLSPFLLPASAFYALGLRWDRWWAGIPKPLPVPVISVGNITVGGTGKTPALLRIVSDLRALGRRPFVLTRGYNGVGKHPRAGVVRTPTDAEGFSDEVKLMADLLPGVALGAGADRLASAKKILAYGDVDVAVLDDGFQHWKLARRLDVVCIDATDPWGAGFLLPLGRLREPASALSRAGIVLITRCERVSDARADAIAATARAKAPTAAVVRSRFELKIISTDGRAVPTPQRALALSAIGNPAAFEANLNSLGIETVPLRYPDHYSYTSDDLAYIAAVAQGVPVVTTAKDWVKLRELSFSAPVLIAAQTLVFEPGGLEVWKARLLSALEIA